MLDDPQLKWGLIYLGVITVFSKMPKDHLVWSSRIIKEAWLKLKPSKCEFFKKSFTFLGHRISEKGIETDDSKITVICKWPSPKQSLRLEAF